MRRRTFLLAGSAAVLGGGSAFAVTQTDLLNEGAETIQPSASSFDGIEYQEDGVARVEWHEGQNNREVRLTIFYKDPSPSFVRLLDHEGQKVWIDDAPEPGSTAAIPFTLPWKRRGMWTITVEYQDTYSHLKLPITPVLGFVEYGLEQETVIVQAENPGDAPNWLESIAIVADKRQSESWDIQKRLLPGDTHLFEQEYPFEYYQNVAIKLFDGVEVYEVKTDFA